MTCDCTENCCGVSISVDGWGYPSTTDNVYVPSKTIPERNFPPYTPQEPKTSPWAPQTPLPWEWIPPSPLPLPYAPRPTPVGWECPKCGTVNAPWMPTCAGNHTTTTVVM